MDTKILFDNPQISAFLELTPLNVNNSNQKSRETPDFTGANSIVKVILVEN